APATWGSAPASTGWSRTTAGSSSATDRARLWSLFLGRPLERRPARLRWGRPAKATPGESPPMSSEGLHVPCEKLKPATLNLHYAIASLIEELDAVDWYRQRADDCDDPELRKILLHNAREEIEHAAMALEWIRRADAEFDA